MSVPRRFDKLMNLLKIIDIRAYIFLEFYQACKTGSLRTHSFTAISYNVQYVSCLYDVHNTRLELRNWQDTWEDTFWHVRFISVSTSLARLCRLEVTSDWIRYNKRLKTEYYISFLYTSFFYSNPIFSFSILLPFAYRHRTKQILLNISAIYEQTTLHTGLELGGIS